MKNQSNINRAKEIYNGDTNSPEIGIYDIDSAFLHFFTNEVSPNFQEFGQNKPVTVKYANQERWADIRHSQHIRDRDNKLILPIILLNRESIEDDQSLAKLRYILNSSSNSRVIQKKYTNKNRFDKIQSLQNQVPVYELYNVAVPNYVTLTYNASILSYYQEEINHILEKIIHLQGGSFGQNYKFQVKASQYSNEVINDFDSERVIQSNINFTVNAYILPKYANDRATTKKEFTITNIVTKITEE